MSNQLDMGYCWGWVLINPHGECHYRLNNDDYESYSLIKTTDLPKWVQARMLLLDFMSYGVCLPCGSYVHRYDDGDKLYTICMEVR